eukprot:TRINITY_DN937_c0_g1_i4.p1 TRINITY_DN937_c0_g1~~TRINITY_DN937_c0_g1_i4.p1  ORF type:complete len:167 (+),score=56.41 TRINITY_DN937_c0_g1_i4:1919-2419(+)
MKTIHWEDDSQIRLQMWDIAGQERFGSMTRVFYKEALGAIIVFDVTRPASFESAAKWKADIDSKVFFGQSEEAIPSVLLANKVDLGKDMMPQPSQMENYCREHSFEGWFETSAKMNVGIEDAITFLVRKILNRMKDSNYDSPQAEEGVIKIGEGSSVEPGKKKDCC